MHVARPRLQGRVVTRDGFVILLLRQPLESHGTVGFHHPAGSAEQGSDIRTLGSLRTTERRPPDEVLRIGVGLGSQKQLDDRRMPPAGGPVQGRPTVVGFRVGVGLGSQEGLESALPIAEESSLLVTGLGAVALTGPET